MNEPTLAEQRQALRDTIREIEHTRLHVERMPQKGPVDKRIALQAIETQLAGLNAALRTLRLLDDLTTALAQLILKNTK